MAPSTSIAHTCSDTRHRKYHRLLYFHKWSNIHIKRYRRMSVPHLKDPVPGA